MVNMKKYRLVNLFPGLCSNPLISLVDFIKCLCYRILRFQQSLPKGLWITVTRIRQMFENINSLDYLLWH